MKPQKSKTPKLSSTNVVVTQGINASIEDSARFNLFLNKCLTRHFAGDWGDLPKNSKADDEKGILSDADINNAALKNGSRILSSYKFPESLKGQTLDYYNTAVTEKSKIWIITDAVGENGKRNLTTVLFPSEY